LEKTSLPLSAPSAVPVSRAWRAGVFWETIGQLNPTKRRGKTRPATTALAVVLSLFPKCPVFFFYFLWAVSFAQLETSSHLTRSDLVLNKMTILAFSVWGSVHICNFEANET